MELIKRKFGQCWVFVVATIIFVLVSCGRGSDEGLGPKLIGEMPPGLSRLAAHPFLDSRRESIASRTLSLSFGLVPMPKREEIASYLQAELAGAGLPASMIVDYSRDVGPGVSEFRLKLKDSFLCESVIKIIRYGDGRFSIVGNMPSRDIDFSAGIAGTDSWPREQDAVRLLSSTIADADNPKALSQCWWVGSESLSPVIKVGFGLPEGHYTAWVSSSQILGLRPDFLHAQGTIKAYETNVKDASTKNAEIELDGEGKSLTSYYLTTESGDQSIARASSPDGIFDFPEDSAEFREANVFVHATEMLNWFFSLGFAWWGPTPLDLVVNWDVNGNTNNALYQPATANPSGRPSISVGRGDGRVLQNLMLDSDVVSHEMGHHIAFGTFSSTTGESLIVHEGLADFFVFLKSGDSCLGESICPAGSSLCIQDSRCLRRGDLPLTFNDSEYSRYASHQKGQVLSAALLDLHRNAGMDETTLAKLVLGAISLLVPGDGFRALFLDLLAADQQQNGGQNQCKILDVLKNRGFASQLDGASCCGERKACIEQASGSAKSTASKSKSKDEPWYKKAGGCAIVGSPAGSTPNSGKWILILPILIAVVTSGLGTRQRVGNKIN